MDVHLHLNFASVFAIAFVVVTGVRVGKDIPAALPM